jgi:potassium-dependent mechanosensitive channel
MDMPIPAIKSRLVLCIAMTLFFAAICRAQTASMVPASTTVSTQSATTPASGPSVSPPPIAPAEVASRAETTLISLRNMESDLLNESAVQSIEDELPGMSRDIDNRIEETNKILATHASLESFQNIEAQWQVAGATLTSWRNLLASRAKQFSRQIAMLAPMESDWQQTLAWAQAVHAHPEIIEHVKAAISDIDHTRVDLKTRQMEIWATARAVDAQDARVEDILATVQQAHELAFSRLLVRDSPPIWRAEKENGAPSSVQGIKDAFRQQLAELGDYIQRHDERLGIHALVLIVCSCGLIWIRRRLRARAAGDPQLAKAMAAFERPIATATVLSFVASIWIYPDAPQLLWALVGAAALVPTVLILRRLIDRRLIGILNVLVILFFLDQLRSILAAQPLVFRILFLAEMAGVAAYLSFFQKKFWATAQEVSNSTNWSAFGRLTVRGAIALFLFAFFASAFGYCSLANLLGDATLASAYLAIIFYASVRIAEGLLFFALRAWPLNRIHLVARHEALVLSRLQILLAWCGTLLWIYEMLDQFSIRGITFDWSQRILAATLSIGSISLSLGHVLAFVVTIWASVLLSRFMRFVLAEEIYDRFDLPTGIPYAISRLLTYLILVWGFCIAVAALGYDMTKFTILVGAFGVGLGFGMQNIVNNFVSGIILLFERPIKVGDVIQMTDTTGVVQHIGIRASIMRTPEGSEIIIPNGSILSDRVINWTLTNGQRAVVLQINVAPGPDPNHVIDLLKTVAKANPQILPRPAPEAYVTKFSSDAFSFELRAWTDQQDTWIKLRSDLSMAIYNAALKEGLTLK